MCRKRGTPLSEAERRQRVAAAAASVAKSRSRKEYPNGTPGLTRRERERARERWWRENPPYPHWL